MKNLNFKQALFGLLLPLAVVVAVVVTGNNIVIALFGAVLTEAIYCLAIGFKWDAVNDALMKGGGDMLGAVLVMILVGFMIALWMASGTIPTLLYYGMKAISPAFFLPLSFILCLLTSIATGTSWGTAGTMGIALVGVAQGLGMPVPMVVGCILCGALIGDKMSPLSDSVLLASASSNSSIFDLIPCMMYTTVPAAIICIIYFGIVGLRYSHMALDLASINVLTSGLQETFIINPIMLIPPVIVVVMSIRRIPALLTFSAGIISSILLAMIFQGETINTLLEYAVSGYVSSTGVETLDSLLSRGGAFSMAQVVFASLMAGMFAGTLKYLGILEVLTSRIELVVKSSTSLIITTLLTCLVLMLCGGGQYSALTLPGAAFGKLYEEKDVHPAVLGRTMEDIATMLDPVIPWTVSGIFYSGLFDVSVAAYAPYTIIAFLTPLLAVINAIFGLGVFRIHDKISYKPFWRRRTVSET